MIVSVVNQKGGVGKTTVAVHLADGLADAGRNVLLLDTDPQGSVLQWHAIAGSPRIAVEHRPEPLNRRRIRALVSGVDDLVIDSPPALNRISRANLAAADLAVIPIGPSPLDIWSGKETVDLVSGEQNRRPSLAAGLLICRKIPRTRIGREAREALATYGIRIFDSEICQRIAYVEAITAGLSVLQYAPGSEAAEEVRRLCKEISTIR